MMRDACCGTFGRSAEVEDGAHVVGDVHVVGDARCVANVCDDGVFVSRLAWCSCRVDVLAVAREDAMEEGRCARA